MSRAIHILHLEDNPEDAELIEEALRADGLTPEITRVETEESYIAAVRGGRYDLVLSDFKLPGFNGLAALEVTRKRNPDLPFILVSGTLGEEAAVESLRKGATDYVLKERLAKLASSVRRALAEAEERRARREAEVALRSSQAQLQQAQKMEAIGRLAGGVAHDFNNLLTAMLGYAQLAQERTDLESARSDLVEIERAAERAASLTRQLLAFSRQQVMQPRILDLNALIAEMETMLRRLIGADVKLRCSLSQQVGRIKADPTQIEQVVLNLVVNARDAMPEGGRLRIETSEIEVVGSEGPAGVGPGPYVVLAVTDSGCGMDAETQSKIFEPFFTTKEVGKGTGLGLSTVLGIVQQSGGSIDVRSEPQVGTSFRIYLPRVAGPIEGPATRSGPPPAGGSETVLLIEDEDLVRQVVSECLRGAGYTVVEARDRDHGMEIIEACWREEIRIDLVLTDLIMSGLGLAEMAERLDRLRPSTKILVMSGYPERGIPRGGILGPGSPLPFSIAELLGKVREVLDSSSVAPNLRADLSG